jgi:sulfur carrier protein ThiS
VIQISLLNFVAQAAPDKRRQFAVPYEDGLTVADVIAAEGLVERGVQLVIVNGRPVSLQTRLSDGDRVALSAIIGGG